MKTSQETVRNSLQLSIGTAFCGALAKYFILANRILNIINRCFRNIIELLLIVRRQERRISELLLLVRRQERRVSELLQIVRRQERCISELSLVVRRYVPIIRLYRISNDIINQNIACLQNILVLQLKKVDRI